MVSGPCAARPSPGKYICHFDPSRTGHVLVIGQGYEEGYLVCEKDAIDDRLRLVGFLDDFFIVHLAVELIEPNRERTAAGKPPILADQRPGPIDASRYAKI